jgi:hypothetical protein
MPREAVLHHGNDVGWRQIRRYAYVERPFEDVWPLLTRAPGKQLLESGRGRHHGTSPLHAHLAGLDVSRTVKVRFGGVVCDDEVARLALRWEDASHPLLFPVLEGVIELAPLICGPRQIAQVGIIGEYRPPLGRVGSLADDAAGAVVASESVQRFLEDLVRRFAAMVEPVPPDEEPDAAAPEDPDIRRVFVCVERLDRRPAVGVAKRLAAAPGVVHAEVDPLAGLAEIAYDPLVCDIERLVADLEDEDAPREDARMRGGL